MLGPVPLGVVLLDTVPGIVPLGIEEVFGGHPPWHEVTIIVEVVNDVEIKVVEFWTIVELTGHVVSVV